MTTRISSCSCWRVLLLALLLVPVLPCDAQDALPCAQEIERAEVSYQEGRFDDVITTLAPCAASPGRIRAEIIQAHRLLSLAYLRQDDPQAARTTLRALLRHVPDYTPDPVQDPPLYTAMVAIVRGEIAPQAPAPPSPQPFLKRRSTWLALGGGLLLIGVLSVVTGGGE